ALVERWAFRLLDAHGRNAVVPGVVAVEVPLAEVGNVASGFATASAEVAVVKNADAGPPEDADGGNVVAEAPQFFAGFSAAQAEEVTAEVAIAIETGASPPPI